jgi:hypothetical protein
VIGCSPGRVSTRLALHPAAEKAGARVDLTDFTFGIGPDFSEVWAECARDYARTP